MDDRRLEDLIRFYELLDTLEQRLGGARTLQDCSGRMRWPQRGVYFFRQDGETRSQSGSGPRIVRVGTHALKAGSATSLWTRLSQHKGRHKSGGGNHRGSIFRLIVGAALLSDRNEVPTWGDKSVQSAARATELRVEREVSTFIGSMPFLWLSIDDEAGPSSLRGYVERNAIALLSNYNRAPIDPPCDAWLGLRCNRERVRSSGLWNSNHVDEAYDREFLDRLEHLVEQSEWSM